jgi:hypothetical protein
MGKPPTVGSALPGGGQPAVEVKEVVRISSERVRIIIPE